MERDKYHIEIIWIGRNAAYSIGKINITKQGDVYVIPKIGDIGLHLSRHKGGNRHIRTRDDELYKFPEKRGHINDVNGLEFIETWSFSIDSLCCRSTPSGENALKYANGRN
jgi:hypothetical protein